MGFQKELIVRNGIEISGPTWVVEKYSLQPWAMS